MIENNNVGHGYAVVKERLAKVIQSVTERTNSRIASVVKIMPIVGATAMGVVDIGCSGDDFSQSKAIVDAGSETADVKADVVEDVTDEDAGVDADVAEDVAQDVVKDVVEEDAAEDVAQDVVKDVVEEDAAEDVAQDVVKDVVEEDAAEDVAQDVLPDVNDAGCTGIELYVTNNPGYDYFVARNGDCSDVVASTVNDSVLEQGYGKICLHSGDKLMFYTFYTTYVNDAAIYHNDLMFSGSDDVVFTVRRNSFVHNGAPDTAMMEYACNNDINNGVCANSFYSYDKNTLPNQYLYYAQTQGCNASYDPQDLGTMFSVVAP